MTREEFIEQKCKYCGSQRCYGEEYCDEYQRKVNGVALTVTPEEIQIEPDTITDDWIKHTYMTTSDYCIKCPLCGGSFSRKHYEKPFKYCPDCGRCRDESDASDAEIIDMLQDTIEGYRKSVQELQEIIVNQRNRLNAYKRQIIDLTESTILANWQDRCLQAESMVEHLEEKLEQAEIVIARKIFADVKSEIMDYVADYSGNKYHRFDELKKKYKVED